jgi:hypothetical protein
MDPTRVDVAARAVKYDVIPHFEAQRGARRGLWMANRASGEVLVVTIWLDRRSLSGVRPADGALRADVIERTGLSTRMVHTMEVLGATPPDPTWSPARSVRATWVAGVAPGRVHHPGPARRSSGFCGGYWFAEATTGTGLVLSLWDGPADRGCERPARLIEDALGGSISRTGEYELLGVAAL